MTTRRTLFVLCGIAVLLGSLAMIATPLRADAQDASTISMSSFDLDFPGGTVEAYIRAVQERSGELNVVMTQPTDPVMADRMPEVTLRGVNAGAALRLLHGRSIRLGDKVSTIVIDTIREGASAPIYFVRSEVQSLQHFGGLQTRVLSISDLADKEVSPESVLTAIEVALTTADAIDNVRMRFHEETHLLIVQAESRDVDVIEQVLDAMRDGVSRREKDEVRRLELAVKQLQMREDELAVQLAQQKAERNDARRQALEAQQRFDRALRRIAELEQMMHERETMIKALEDRIKELGG